MKSQFVAQQYVQYITLWICCTTKDEFHKKCSILPPQMYYVDG